ncbi:hypothetical protein LSH36_1020g00044 [Paralvinella palmiformis]|uniref:Uncharacterized protein n=1 Tax=Paralvinella palmiformis TaxID=53620 RepID=A0AAD9IW03_9ANNE|nr:hypothetical protein LSH36_1020g00044 [Paralvinella palmiformis]
METRTAAVSSSTAIPFDVVPHGWKNAGLNLDGEGWRRLVFVAGSEGGGYLTARQVYLDDVKLAEKPCIQENGLDVQSLNRMLGHQKEQMLIECTWQGSTCQNDSLSHTYTDKGYCFTFNFNESNILKTTETGKLDVISHCKVHL